MHYPIKDFDFSQKTKILPSATKFLEIAKDNKVKLICSGHYHYKEFSEINGLISIVSPALVEYPHEYLTIKLSDTTLDIQGVEVIDKFVIQESETLTQKRIKRLKYIYPDLKEGDFKAKIKGEKNFNFIWKKEREEQ